MTISIKAIVPRAQLPKGASSKIRTLARALFWRDVHSDLERTIATWEQYPHFTQKGNSRVRIRGDEVTVEFFVNNTDAANRIWNWLEQGTAVRHYSFSDFSPKTEVGNLDSFEGQWRPKWYNPDQEGIAGRGWWSIILMQLERNRSWHEGQIQDTIMEGGGYLSWLL